MAEGYHASISILASALPTVLYVVIVWWFDRYEREPLWLLAAAFAWGALPAAVISLFIETLTSSPAATSGTLSTLLVERSLIVPLVEEGAKALALIGIYLLRQREFNGVLDGIIYGALVGFGFGMTENVAYYVSHLAETGRQGWGLLIVMRGIVFGSNHALFSSIMGVGLGVATLTRKRWQRVAITLLGFGVAVSFHSAHNLFTSLSVLSLWAVVVSVASDWGGLVVLGVILFLAWRREKAWLREQLRGEVTSGLLTEEEHTIIGSYRRRVGRWYKALVVDGWREARRWGRLFHLGTELAFQKERRERRGDEEGLEKRITELREALRLLRAESDPRVPFGARVCPHCDHPIGKANRYCTHCGKAVNSRAAVLPKGGSSR